MIIKHFQLNDSLLKKNNFFLFYGNNEGLKNEIIEKLKNKEELFLYDDLWISYFLSFFKKKKILSLQNGRLIQSILSN